MNEHDTPIMDWFDERHFAEDVGLLFDVLGNDRMAGRVWGLMVIAEDDELSSADLAERLRASSGSISAATRMLMGLGLLEPVRRPGDRKSWFRVRSGGMARLTAQRQMVITQARRMAERGIEEFGDRPAALPRLEEWRDIYAFWERELPPLMDKYEDMLRRQRGSAG
ncbi:MAG: winged helix DNA-binding protein [Actinomycetota bacterium]|nr:MarR family transcriptional regulator [Actinomycetota bacterium]